MTIQKIFLKKYQGWVYGLAPNDKLLSWRRHGEDWQVNKKLDRQISNSDNITV